jgi:pilus assembly protein CpaB
MNRRTRTIVVMGIAILCATIASAAVLLAIRKGVKPPPPEPKVSVVVAARAVPMGICLGEEDVKAVEWPAKNRPPGGIPDVKTVLNRGLKASLTENEPVSEAKLASPKEGCGLVPSIKAGKRAISVKVNEVIGVAGFVVPGALVDVVVTIRQDRESTSRAVVSNVEVLAAGTGLDQDKAKDGKPMPTTVVTLMVTPSEAERIALAAAEGQILLTLRNPLDEGETRTNGVTTPELMSGTRATASPRPQAQGGPVGYRVEYIRGGKPSQGVAK